MHKIKFAKDGTILAIGTEVDGQEIDETTLPDDFGHTFSLGKYKATENGDKTISVVPVQGFVMPEPTMYRVDEIAQMNVEQLLVLQTKLQGVIDQKKLEIDSAKI